MPKPRFILHTKTQIYAVQQNLDLCSIAKPRFTLYTKDQIYTVYQNLDLYHIPIPRFISDTKTQNYIVYKNLDLYRIPKPRFISHTKTQIYIAYLELCLYLEFDDSGQLSTKIYDKRDDFNFKIINFPNMCRNIPASPAYGVYISQLIRYARASSNYSDFLKRHLHLRNRLLDQGYKKIRLIRSLKKFIFRYQYLVEIYSVSAEKIISDAFSYSENV